MKKIVSGITLSLLLIGMLTLTPSIKAHYRTITVDGNSIDWSGIPPIIIDPEEFGNRIDIREVYVANNDSSVFFRVDFAGALSVPFQQKIKIYIQDIYMALFKLGTDEILKVLLPPGTPIPIEFSGNTVEFGVPLSLLGNPTAIDFYVESYGFDPVTGDLLGWDYAPDTGTVHYTMQMPVPLSATVDIDPDTLNLRSRGKWITAYIELPSGYNVADINVSTIMLNNTIPAELMPTAIGDYDNDTVPDLMVKFDRQAVIDLILANCRFINRFGTTTLTIAGYLNDGTPFQGSDTIKIIMPMPRHERLIEFY